MKRRYAAIASLMLVSVFGAGAQADSGALLPAERAFVIGARQVSGRTIAVDFNIAPGYVLYRERFSFATDEPKVRLVSAAFPVPVVKFDKAMDREVAYYSDHVSIQFDVAGDAVPFRLIVKAQGCAVEQGVCYPPISKDFQVPAFNKKGAKQ